jgi:hypothetical protein
VTLWLDRAFDFFWSAGPTAYGKRRSRWLAAACGSMSDAFGFGVNSAAVSVPREITGTTVDPQIPDQCCCISEMIRVVRS